MPRTPATPSVTLPVSPRFVRRTYLRIVGPLVLASAVGTALFAMLPAGMRVPVPFFPEAHVVAGPSLTLAIGGIMAALVAIAVLALHANARRLARAPYVVATPAALELPQHRVRIAWDDVIAIVPRDVALEQPWVNVMLRPSFTREQVMSQHRAAVRSRWDARLAALSFPLLKDRSGASYLPLMPRMVDMTPAELAGVLERMRGEARIAVADPARAVRAM